MHNWSVVRYDLDLIARDWPTELTGPIADLDDLLARWRTVDRQRFIMRGDGSVDVRVNAFLSSARMRTLASTTNRDYAQSLCLWLSFLQTKEVCGPRRPPMMSNISTSGGVPTRTTQLL